MAAMKTSPKPCAAAHRTASTRCLRSQAAISWKIAEEVELDPIIDQLAARPPLDLPYGKDLEALFPVIVGGLSVALARSFKIVDPTLKKSVHRALAVIDAGFRSAAGVGEHSQAKGPSCLARPLPAFVVNKVKN
jgi:hypothetical protein